MPLQATSGAASYDAFGGGAAAGPQYIEDVFSTYLWATAQPTTVVNGIDLATKGGMVWTKLRNNADYNRIWDSARGPTKRLITDITAAQVDEGIYGQVFNTNGFTDRWFGSGYNAVSWTFRKQPKFFDVVTYTGNGVAGRTIPHSLGTTPGMIIVKCTSSDNNWGVYHRSLGATKWIQLNANVASETWIGPWNNTEPTSTIFTVGGVSMVNSNGATYVAYLFAHDAGGFGLTGTDNVISCGSYTGNGSTTAAGAVDINLGWEPQWVLVKSATSTGGDANWSVLDTMRGWGAINSTGNKALYANTSGAEQSNDYYGYTTSTGFKMWETNVANNGTTYIYIAIRRPMKVPTTGTSVFNPQTYTGNGSNRNLTTNFPVDATFNINTDKNWNGLNYIYSRLTGNDSSLAVNSTQAEQPASSTLSFTTSNANTGIALIGSSLNGSARPFVQWSLSRAPGFFDVVCYTASGANATRPHNLGVVPEMMIVKKRSGTGNWAVYHSALGAAGWILLNTSAPSSAGSDFWQSTTPTSTNFFTGINGNVGDSGQTYIAYLFVTLAGVSRVGSYTGNGTGQTINCGFTGGARFVMVKRTDTTDNWVVVDSARGMANTSVNPGTWLNTQSQDQNSQGITAVTGGFQLFTNTNSNASGGTYIYLAIA